MFIFTARLTRGRIAAGVAVAALLCGAVFTAAGALSGGHVTASAAVSPKNIRTNQDRVAYLASYGWEVSADPVAVEELILPEEPDETYQQYLDLQASQGFDLGKYAGKRVKRYTYTVLNYPTGEEDIQANLLLCQNTVVGGDILCTDLDGFLHGLAMP
ncbi:DUF4830 domain-containing protein [Flavonifractor sp. An92]|uniref:DUF4830 domain-containing protein n=1 Tax=Flavonifractor sp. An92 TaxID=1965666 RepID=UPI000B374F54|nr:MULTISPECIES: DUF4830 domain-containing protein [unclassified Flavonifractor]OUN06722.1 DUF4830 domain-containing protein [Flavonifractor sp. An92]OUQ26724.1 DUF4830 domain-containing protein [Flavonifractor sp. An135]